MTDRYEQEMVDRAGRHPDMIYCRECDAEYRPDAQCDHLSGNVDLLSMVGRAVDAERNRRRTESNHYD